jgi:anti-sigma factor RsiW
MICSLHDHHRCRELFDRLSDYIDGDMGDAERRTFEAHLSECLGCLSCLQSLQRTIALCKHTARRSAPAFLSERLCNLMRNPPKSA